MMKGSEEDTSPEAQRGAFSPFYKDVQKAGAGMGLSFSLTILANPLDVLRVRMQHAPSASMFDVIEGMYHEGMRGVWRGIGPSLTIETLKGAYRPILASETQHVWELSLSEEQQCLVPVMTVTSNASADTVALTSLESCKIRQMTHDEPLSVKEMISQPNAFGAMRRGSLALFGRQSMFFGAIYGSQGVTSSLIKDHQFTPAGAALTTSLGVGVVSTVAGTPFDVVKTQQQAGDLRGVKDILLDTYQHSGMSGMFRGLVPRMLLRSGSAFAVIGATCFIDYQKQSSCVEEGRSTRWADRVGSQERQVSWQQR